MNPLTDRIASLSPERRALLALRLQAHEAAAARPGAAEPIAVVGIGCRLPGGLQGPDAYWAALRGGVDAVAEIPPDRWDVERYYDPAPATPGKMNTRWGGFLDDIDKFDARFFGIPPREAESMDPQQRVLLEVSWEALEHAGLATDRLAGSTTGIFVGICRNDYGQLHGVVEDPTRIDAYFGTGNALSFAAGRISYLLGLHGPSLAVDTACSSSLVAVHLACQSLRAGECQTALAGGVNLILSPTVNICLSQLRTFAPDGRCKAFDNKADGYVRGEGCGVVVLRRLSDALADGDDVLAVIRGTAINQDGRSAGLTAPSGPAQEAVIRQALLNASVGPLDVDFVEAHGTGTSLGDPIELRALGAVLGRSRDRERPLVVGSVKTNLGHLEAAAGVAGLIKLVLAIRHGEIPKHLHFDEPSSYIPWHELPILIPTERLPWAPENKRRVGAVSSFGFSGTNAHVVLEEAPPAAKPGADAAPEAGVGEEAAHLLPLSARDAGALREMALRWRDLLTSGRASVAGTRDADAADAGEEETPLSDLCYSASVRRAHHRPHRLAAAAGSRARLASLLDSFLSGEPAPGLFAGERSSAPRVVFVYPGQGGQWQGMGRDLFVRSPVFRRAVEECDELLNAHAPGWRLLDAFTAEGVGAEDGGWCFELTQCALFALQVGLTRLWRSYGVEPCAVVGHSLGEVAAAEAAGVLTLGEAVRVVYERSRLLGSVPRRGAMAAVELTAEEAEELVADAGGALGVAAVNGRRASVISGEAGAVARAVEELGRRGVMAREVRTGGVAGHSPLVAEAGRELEKALSGLRGRAGRVAFVSTVEGREVAGAEVDGGHWGRGAAGPVRFREAMSEAARVCGAGGVYVEVGAHPALGLWVREAAEGRGGVGAVLAAQRRGESGWAVTLEGLGEAYAAGVDVQWGQVYGESGGARGRYVRVPTYPWQRRRFWLQPPEPENERGIYSEADIAGSPGLKALVDGIVRRHGREGALAVNRRYMAPRVFICSTRRSLFYLDLRDTSLVALIYVGPDEEYELLVRELLDYAGETGCQLNLIATEDGVDVLERLGFTTTPCGSFQSISDLGHFTLEGNRMRRLRYQVERYKKQGACVTKEYAAGSDPAVDREVTEIIDEWISLKEKRVPFADTLKQDIRAGTLDPRLRLFLTYGGERLDSVILISPAPASNGYLMDLEFYRRDVPQGCLEFAITEIIRQLLKEGYSYFSLGGSFGTRLDPHPNADPEVERLFAALRQENVLNGDGNFQFKSKFRPDTSALYLCRPRGSGASGLSEVLLTLSGETDGGAAPSAAAGRFNGNGRPAGPGRAERVTRRDREGANRNLLHPLLGERLQLAIPDAVFQSRHDLNSLPFLKDHRVGGVVVLPGTAYLEMGLAAAKETFGEGPYALADISMQQAMVFAEGAARTIQLVLKQEENGAATFQILSAGDGGEQGSAQWSLHATGSVRTGRVADAPSRPESAAEVCARCAEQFTGEEFYRSLEREGLTYGPSFQGVGHVWRREGEAIARVEAPEPLAAEAGDYLLHPALLDACLQVFESTITAAEGEPDDLYLLRGVEEVLVYDVRPGRVWSHVLLREKDEAGAGLYTGDLRLYDEGGKTVAEVRGVSAKRVKRDALLRSTQERVSGWLYEIEWRPSDEQTRPTDPEAGERGWLVFGDGGGVGAELQELLRSRGRRCVLALAGKGDEARRPDEFYLDPGKPEEFRELLREAAGTLGQGPLGIVHLWGLDAARPVATTRELEEGVRRACESVLHLVQALTELNLAASSRLWLATRGAQSARAESPASGLPQSPLWGLGRVISVEHTEAWGGLIDLDVEGTAGDAPALLAEITRPADGENQVVYRGGRRLVARLARGARPKPNAAPLTFKAQATYLLTGALGGLGLGCARWLFEHGARNLALVGRGEASGEALQTISELEKGGARVKVFRADVTREEQVEEVIAEIKSSMPPLRGIVHAAGVLDDGMVHKQTWGQFERVLAPKVRGAWLLHTLTLDTPLDFFVLFSSAASMFGSAGQANHAAANAFLDALAHHRRALGLQALSVNWGAWSEVGAAAERNVSERLAPKGIEPIEPQQGWRALETVFRHPRAQVGVIPINWKQWGRLYGREQMPPLVSELMRETAEAPTARAGGRDGGTLREQLLKTEPGGRPAALQTYLCRQVARTLRADASGLDGKERLSDLGIDSIMTVELRDRIDADWQVKLPLVEFFREPTIERLACVLLEQLGLEQPGAAADAPDPAPRATRADPAALLSTLGQLSEDEVDGLLDRMLPEESDGAAAPSAVTR